MKHFWGEDELAEHFTLTSSDWELIGQKPTESRLGFAIMLKCLQYEGAFPKQRADVPLPVVRFVAAQLGVDRADFDHDHFKGRTAERHRSQIRAALGYRSSTEQDLKDIGAWLVAHLQPEDHYTDTAKEAALEHLHELRIEPPSYKQLRRALKSACHTAEEQLAIRIADRLPKEVQIALDDLLRTSRRREDKQPGAETGASDVDVAPEAEERRASLLFTLKRESGRASLKSILREVERLQIIRDLRLPATLFPDVHQKVLQALRQRVFTEEPFELRRHPDALRYFLLAAFCWLRSQELTDNLIEQLNQIVYKIGAKAEKKADDELMSAVKRLRGKTSILRKIAQESIKRPHDAVDEVVYPAAGGKHVLEDIATELEAISGYDDHIQLRMRSSYAGHYRRMVPPILRMLIFRSNNDAYRPVMEAIELLKRYADITGDYPYFAEDETIPLTDVVPERWMPLVQTENGRINRIAYEICALQALRDKLRCKEIWIEGALRYRNPEDDLPKDFDARREAYYQALNQPLDADEFIEKIQNDMRFWLDTLDRGLPKNEAVRISKQRGGWIHLTPLAPLPEPPHLGALKDALLDRWSVINLLDMLKETDLRIGVTSEFHTSTAREHLDRTTLQKRLLLCF